jgi:3-hydroxymyristoyl/3-hydroxydecanoyl-(acyl carrier protein) dehydratase
MDPHFRAFTFVHRITSTTSAGKISGYFDIPAAAQSFPGSLVSEAVGQLAAWAAMSAVQFNSRPVAGLAAAVYMLGQAKPGQRLELSAELDSVDNEAISYGGTATANGQPIVRLEHCVGPMVPLDQFDDPAAVRDRYALLCDGGSNSSDGSLVGLPALDLERTQGEPGQLARARLTVPTSAAFFGDHFPRRAVFPGSLLMHCCLELVGTLASQIPAPSSTSNWRLEKVSDMKLRSFIPPGEILDLEARLLESAGDSPHISIESRAGKRLVGGARVTLAPDSKP